jgi:hypothetical protein
VHRLTSIHLRGSWLADKKRAPHTRSSNGIDYFADGVVRICCAGKGTAVGGRDACCSFWIFVEAPVADVDDILAHD